MSFSLDSAIQQLHSLKLNENFQIQNQSNRIQTYNIHDVLQMKEKYEREKIEQDRLFHNLMEENQRFRQELERIHRENQLLRTGISVMERDRQELKVKEIQIQGLQNELAVMKQRNFTLLVHLSQQDTASLSPMQSLHLV